MRKLHRKLARDILDDVLAEIHGEESLRPKGVGITSQEYVEAQLLKLWDLISDGIVPEKTFDKPKQEVKSLASYSNKIEVRNGN